MKNVLNLLREEGRSFSKGQRAIARYILESYDKAAFMTAAQLAKTVGVSESTVVRFAVELEFEGYPSLQKALQELVMQSFTVANPGTAASEEKDPLTLALEKDMEQLRKTCELADREAFYAAVDAALGAQEIYIVGIGASVAPATYLGYYMEKLLDRVRVITEPSAQALFEQLIKAGHKDLLIGISFPEYASPMGELADYCRSKGMQVVGITDSALSPLGRNSDLLLTAKTEGTSRFASLAAAMSLLQGFLAALANRREAALQNRSAELEWLRNKYQIFGK